MQEQNIPLSVETFSKHASDRADQFWLQMQTGSYRIPKKFKDVPFLHFAEEVAEVMFEQYIDVKRGEVSEEEFYSRIETNNFLTCYRAFAYTFAEQLQMWQEKETLNVNFGIA
jgi:hypothetical protein